eukprot:TRINITY_DN70779_c0_g1_i1.p1 TRINITY_DN70779_c0_g1~~TRINITY_DN70779_c0_g1_i1.p1  ORF type:complete len:343 (-),score=35.23 TRINITY_DN70779_c0_g1_i1:150-1178(-)
MAAKNDLAAELLPDNENGSRSPTPALLAGCIGVFIASGVSQPLLKNYVKLAGLGDMYCQLYTFPHLVGMACVGLLGLRRSYKRWLQYPLHRSFAVALIFVLGHVVNYTAEEMAGKLLFSLIHASTAFWCTLLSWGLVDRSFSAKQIFMVMLLCAGLSVAGLNAKCPGRREALGSGLSFVGAFLNALVYVLSEGVTASGEDQVPSPIHCCILALVSFAVLCFWITCYASCYLEKLLDHTEVLWEEPLKANFMFSATALCSFLQSGAFFFLLSWIGAVSAAVMKAVAAVSIFLFAHVLFCEYDMHGQIEHTHCFNSLKGLASAIVVAGAVGYTLSTGLKKDGHE